MLNIDCYKRETWFFITNEWHHPLASILIAEQGSKQADYLSMHLSDIMHNSQTTASIKSSLCWVSHHANILLLPLCSTSWSLKRETMSYDSTSSSTRGGMSQLMSAHPLHFREDAQSPECATLLKGGGWNATKVSLADPSGLLLHRFTKTGQEGLSWGKCLVRSGPHRFIQPWADGDDASVWVY